MKTQGSNVPCVFIYAVILKNDCEACKVFWKGVWGRTFCSQKVSPSLKRSDISKPLRHIAAVSSVS